MLVHNPHAADYFSSSSVQFLQDWWTCTIFNSRFYRTWNVIVHNWIYTYIYKDLHDHVISNKATLRVVCFFVSATIHELILACALRVFLPIDFTLLFGTGVLLANARTPDWPLWHVLFHYSLMLGESIHMVLYMAESYARFNSPVVSTDLLPRIVVHRCIQWGCNIEDVGQTKICDGVASQVLKNCDYINTF